MLRPRKGHGRVCLARKERSEQGKTRCICEPCSCSCSWRVVRWTLQLARDVSWLVAKVEDDGVMSSGEERGNYSYLYIIFCVALLKRSKLPPPAGASWGWLLDMAAAIVRPAMASMSDVGGWSRGVASKRRVWQD